MKAPSSPTTKIASAVALLLALSTTACTVYETVPRPAPPVAYNAEPQAVVSVYVDPPIIDAPPPVLVGWAPPPMLVDVPPPMPFADAVWVGGYWAWHGRWVWAAGRWTAPPQPNLVWVHPYYENRGGAVVFVVGHWGQAGVAFVPPPPTLNLTLAVALPGVVAGPPCIGPQGVFVPAPPGSRPGLIIPAPIGTPPAVVTAAPPVTNVGMRITNNYNNTTNVRNVTNITNVTNVTNVTIVAPANATASGRAYESAVPASAHIAAALPPVVRATAPVPQSQQAIPAYSPGHATPPLPPAQTMRPVVMQTSLHPAAQPVPHAPPQQPAAQPNGPAPSANPAAEQALRERQAQERAAQENAANAAREEAAAKAQAAKAQAAQHAAQEKAAQEKAAKEKAAKEKAEDKEKSASERERREKNENER
ncbi:MAG: hypothetical protein JO369_02005 [Paucibacter sp.]|nr:hypothetical protein [Roseateles sp.]